MLRQLHIENFALISELSLDFKDGLTVVTGETGSGKSILLGALGLVIGGRSNTNIVRHGTKQCSVEATFFSTSLSSILNNWGLEAFDSNEIIIRREVSSSGRSRAFINDSQVSVATLKEVGDLLVDLHGQDETRALLNRVTRLDLLDDFGNHEDLRKKYCDSYSYWQENLSKLQVLEDEISKPQADRDYLTYQLEELSLLNIDETDWTGLEEEYNNLKHATELAVGLLDTFESLDGMLNENGTSTTESIDAAIKSLEDIKHFSNNVPTLLSRLRSSQIEIKDISEEISIQAENISHNPVRLMEVEEKMELLSKALHKHRSANAKELLVVEDKIRSQINHCENLENDVLIARENVAKSIEKLNLSGSRLRKARSICGIELLEIVHRELAPLKLPHVKMSWEFSDLSTPDVYGTEDVELLFSANPGSPQLAMSQVASGGERSRVMLAIKAAIATRKTVPTIVLDEIDTGVSGDVATRMATTMLNMSKGQQVLSVTHLAQVAAKGHHHLEVSKTTSDLQAKTEALYLNDDARREVVATMLSGSTISNEARAAAQVLLKN